MLCAIFVKIAWPFNELIAMPIGVLSRAL